MRPFERFTFLLWGLVLLVVFAQFGYKFQFWGITSIWEIIHKAGHGAGWCGAALMALSLLIIPRKKKWFTLGSMKLWYRLHVVFGLTGPLLIVLHAYGKYHGFGGLGFLCMWVTLLTGIIGHYLCRRLPEEVEIRAAHRFELLDRSAEIESAVSAFPDRRESLRDELSQTSLLSQLTADSAKIKLPRPELAKNPWRIISLLCEFALARKKAKELGSRVRKFAASERSIVTTRERELLKLLSLERDTGMLLVLNELFSIWRKVHIPLSWLMWWIASLHLFAWVYY